MTALPVGTVAVITNPLSAFHVTAPDPILLPDRERVGLYQSLRVSEWVIRWPSKIFFFFLLPIFIFTLFLSSPIFLNEKQMKSGPVSSSNLLSSDEVFLVPI